MTSLEKLKVLLYGETKDEFGRVDFPQRLEIAKELEKELKALEIIKKYIIIEKLDGKNSYFIHNNQYFSSEGDNIMSDEEYEILKEIFQ